MTLNEIGFWLLVGPLGIVLWTASFVCIGMAKKLK